MGSNLRRLLPRLLVLVALLYAAPAARAQDVYKDEALGFELRPPKGWKQIPNRPDETYLVLKYQAPDVDRALDEKTGALFEHRPEMMAIAFLEGDDVPEQKTPQGTTYRDVQEYLKDNYEHGFFVEDEQTNKHKGTPVTIQSIKIEAGIGVLERYITAWTFDVEVGRVTVTYEAISDAMKEHRGEIDKLMKSFKPIKRTEEIVLGRTTDDFLSSEDLEELTPKERKEKKLEAQRAEWLAMVAGLPDGWESEEIDGVPVVTHASKKYTKGVVEQVNAVYAWLEDNFSEVGKGEFARKPIVRICDSFEEERAFLDGSGRALMYGTHLVTHDPTKSGILTSDFIASRALGVWFQERDAELWFGMPAWLREGLERVLGSAVVKRGKLDFRPHQIELMLKGDKPDEDELIRMQELFLITAEEVNEAAKQDNFKPYFQCITTTRFFVDSGGKKYKSVLADYLVNLRRALDEYEAENEDKLKDRKRPENEEEEAAMQEELESLIRNRSRELQERAMELTFGGWDDGDWQSLQRAYGRTL